jgi:hypothetical protein
MMRSIIRSLARRPLLAACLVASLTPSSFAGDLSLPENPYTLDNRRSCGPHCLSFLDVYFGHEERLAEVQKICPAGTFGTTLAQLQQGAEQLGYHTAAFKGVTTDQLKRLRAPALVHLTKGPSEGHFVVVLGWDEEAGRFVVFNPPDFYGPVKPEWFTDKISGLVLAVSADPVPSPEALLEPAVPLASWLGGAALAGAVLAALGRRLGWPRRLVMARCAAVAAMALVLPACGPAAPATGRPDPLDVDAGQVLAGTLIKHDFLVTNKGPKPFKIVHVSKSCSCLAVRFDKGAVVPPGGTTTVGADFPTEGREGPFQQRIALLTDSPDPEFATIPMSLRADVLAKIKAIPSQIMFGSVAPEKAARCELKVKVNRPDLLGRFTSAGVEGNPYLTINRRGESRGLLVFDVELDPQIPPGDIAGQVRLRFDDAEVPELLVKVIGRKQGDLKLVPRSVKLSRGAAAPAPALLRVASASQRPFRILGVESPTGVNVQWDEAGASPSFDLRVSRAARPGPVPDSFVIRTDQPQQGRVKVALDVAGPAE